MKVNGINISGITKIVINGTKAYLRFRHKNLGDVWLTLGEQRYSNTDVVLNFIKDAVKIYPNDHWFSGDTFNLRTMPRKGVVVKPTEGSEYFERWPGQVPRKVRAY